MIAKSKVAGFERGPLDGKYVADNVQTIIPAPTIFGVGLTAFFRSFQIGRDGNENAASGVFRLSYSNSSFAINTSDVTNLCRNSNQADCEQG
jgi:hypothetical protein